MTEYEDDVLDGLDLSGTTTGRFDAAGCRFLRCRLAGLVVEDDARVVDCTFEDCDLSGIVVNEASIVRTTFRRCRLSAAAITFARLKDVCFEECRLDDANLRMSSATGLRVVDSVLTGADLYGVTCKDGRFVDCDLRGVELSKAKLTGTVLVGSRIDGVKGALALAGTVIDSTQLVPAALAVFGALGMRIDDDARQA